MKTDDSEVRDSLQRLSRLVSIAIGLSSACLGVLLFVLLFPQHAEQVSKTSVNIQQALEPYIGGAIGVIFSLLIVFFAAAYVISRVSSAQAPDVSTQQNNQ